MDERNLESIRRHLQDQKVQEQIRKNIERGRSEASVRIGWAAQLFDFKDSQLREWESRGLLNPSRSKDTATGQRQYSLDELDKLAIIRELIDAKFSPGEIPTDIDKLWKAIEITSNRDNYQPETGEKSLEYLPIDQRVHEAYYRKLFWRYYASRALRLSLMLICEDIPNTVAGLVLPLQKKHASNSIPLTDEMPELGEALVGWVGQSRSFYTLLTAAPSFEHPSDFRILPLQEMEEDVPTGEAPKDGTLIVVQRQTPRLLTLNKPVVETIRRLLAPLYHEVRDWHIYLGYGMCDILDPVADFNSGANLPDTILTELANRVVNLGDKTPEGQNQWRFCCILVPNNSHLPLQQQSLVVRAKSKKAPSEYKIGATLISPDNPILSVSLRALQSGRIIYRHKVTAEDTSIAHRNLEEPIGSAIAIPVGGENGLPIGVLYIVSAEPEAFSEKDQSLLRMVSRMVEELLITYRARIQVVQKLSSMFINPAVVDPAFGVFASENDFSRDLEDLLRTIRDVEVEPITNIDEHYTTEEVVSLIAIDINNQTSLTNKYGDRLTKNLSRVVGLKIQGLLRALFTKPSDQKLYHIYADRFYLLLNKVPLNNAREKAELLRQALNGSYEADAVRSSIEQPPLSKSMFVSSDITVRLAIGTYTYMKLQEVVRRYPEAPLASTTAVLARSLDGMLNRGQTEGGSVIISWDPRIWGFIVWPPSS